MLQVPLGTEYLGFKFQVSGFRFQFSSFDFQTCKVFEDLTGFFSAKVNRIKFFKGIEFQKALLGHAGPVYLKGVEIEFFELPQSLAGPEIVDDLCKKPHSLSYH